MVTIAFIRKFKVYIDLTIFGFGVSTQLLVKDHYLSII